MEKTRLEFFSDGVLAIIITIMVLEIKIPHSSSWLELEDLWPVFISYVLSFMIVGIYWVNHHHLLHTVKAVSAGIIWANMNLLFWLSLIPFASGWLGETHFAQHGVILYAILLMIVGIAYYILQRTIAAKHMDDVELVKIYKYQRRKGLISILLYAISIGFSFYNPAISGLVFFIVALMWIVPDRNIERKFEEGETPKP